MVAAVKESPADYTSLGYEKVCMTLLQREKTHLEKNQPIKKSWKTLGLTIVSNGWKDTRNQPLINVIAVSPKGAMFLKAIDCEGKAKDFLEFSLRPSRWWVVRMWYRWSLTMPKIEGVRVL